MAKKGKIDESKIADLTEGYGGEFGPITPDEPASKEEEIALGIGMHTMMEKLADEKFIPKVANLLHQDQRPLMQVIPELLKPMLLAIKSEVEKETGEPAPASIFFAEGGLMQEGVDRLFEFAQALDIPGSDDPDMYSAALMNIHKMAGEHVLETGDEAAISEALELGGDMVAASYGAKDLDDAQNILNKQMRKKGVSDSVEQGLLGGL